jgi:hypothetical protein
MVVASMKTNGGLINFPLSKNDPSKIKRKDMKTNNSQARAPCACFNKMQN